MMRTTLAVLAVVTGCDGAARFGDSGTMVDESSAAPELVCLDPRNPLTGDESAWSAPDEDGELASVSFRVAIDPTHPSLESEGFQPKTQAVTVAGETRGWDIVAAAKTLRAHDGVMRLDLYIAPLNSGLSDAVLTIDAASTDLVHDFRVDPWAPATDARSFEVSHVNKEGFAHFAFGVPVAETMNLNVTFEGIESWATAVNSGPIQLDPNDETLWSVFPDGDVLAAVDLDTEARTQISIPGGPTSTALTPDGEWVVTVSPKCNQVVVVDADSREVVQVLGEAEGVGREPRHVVMTPDGTRAFVTSYVADQVTMLERVDGGFVVAESLSVGRRPTGLSVSPDGQHVYVAHFLPRGPISANHGWMSVIDIERFSLVHEVTFEDQFNVAPADCVRSIPIFETWSAEELSFEGVPKMLAGVFLHPSGQYGLLPGLKSPGFPALEGDLSSWGIAQTRKGANNPAVLYPVNFTESPMGRTMPWQLAQDVVDTSESFLKCAAPTNDIEFVTPRYAAELGGAREELYFYPGTITPGAQTPFMPMGAIRSLGYTRGGRRVLALSHVADMVAVLDGATLQPASIDHLTLSGSNPSGIAVSDDGTRAYVAYDNSLFVSVLDIAAYAGDALPDPVFTPYWLQETAQVTVSLATRETFTRDNSTLAKEPLVTEIGQIPVLDDDPMDPVMRRGKTLFMSSNPVKYSGLSGHPHAACVSCHPDGGSDGSAWGTVEGERRTNSLRGGTSGRGWLHYSATHANITEFLEIVLPERLGGQGLDEDDLHALSLYIADGIPTLQAPVTDPDRVAAGQVVFERACASCHMGDQYTSGSPIRDDPYGGSERTIQPLLYDIGTGQERSGVILGPPFAAIFPEPAGSLLLLLAGDRALGSDDIVGEILGFEPRPERPSGLFKAPSLVNIWDEALLLHNGRFDNLEDLITYKNEFFSFSLTDEERAALLEYLHTI